MAYDLPANSPGVLERHADACPARDGAPCACGPIGYRATHDGRPTGPLLETEADARAWRLELAEQFASASPRHRTTASLQTQVAAPARTGMVPDEAIWLSLKVATLVFVLIALILAAESI